MNLTLGTPVATQKTQRLTRLDQLDAVLAKEETGSKTLRLREGDEADIRRAMSMHFRRAGGEDIGGEAEFESVEEFKVYRVELNSLYERREVARRLVPHDGSQLPPARVTEASLELWAFTNPPPAAFEDGKQELRINESQEVSQCGGCQGRKDSDCTACKTTGAVACKCGNGTTACSACSGKGHEQVACGTRQEWEECRTCNGLGYHDRGGRVEDNRPCMVCGRKRGKYRDVTVYEPVTCSTCQGRRAVRCQICGGSKRVQCGPCSGTGRLPCQKCQGSGTQVSYLAVVRSFTPAVAAVVVGDGVPKPAVRHMSEAGRFGPLVEIDTTDCRDELAPGRSSPALKRAVSQAFEASAAKKPQDGRIARQRLVVGVNRVLKVTYSYEGKSYVLWLMGEEMAVLAPESPLTDTLREKVQEAVGLWEGGDQKKAALALRDALDMCEKDPGCQAAYEELRDGIPRKLQERGKKATTLRRWVRRNPFVVALLLFLLGPPLLWVCLGVVGTLAQRWGSSPDPAARREFERLAAEAGRQETEERARQVDVRFRESRHFLEAGKPDRLRVAVRKKAFGDPLDRDLVLRFEGPADLGLPASVKVEKGQLEVDVPVTAMKAGRYQVRVVPEGMKNTAFSDACTVTVTVPLKPPGAVDEFASLTTKLGDIANWVWSADAADGWKRIPGGIAGSTGHHAGFKEPLPADFDLSFDLRIRSGKIVRIMLKDPKLAIQVGCVAAPDGKLFVLSDLPGLAGLESRPVPHGDKSVRVRLVLSGDVFEFWVGGERAARATRKYRGPAGLALSCGDPKDPAEAEFTNFRISAP